jgi:hypothetical protein
MSRTATALWGLVALGLVALSIPWFLWGGGGVAYGLPTWVWWHVGWMGLTAVVFAVFADRAWGLGIESPEPATREAER